jgi:cytochrome P450
VTLARRPPRQLPAGYLAQLNRDPTGFLLNAAQTMGPVAPLRRSLTLLTEPADIEFVLKHTGSTFSRTHNFLGQPVTEADAPEWEAGRKAVYTELRTAVERSALHHIGRAFDQMMTRWPDEPVDDAIARFEFATGAAIGRICFGADGDRLAASAGQLLDLLFEVAGSTYDPPVWAPGRRRAKRCAARLSEEVRAVVDARRSHDSIDDLAGMLTSPDGGDLSAGLATRMLVSVLLAGHGVPAVALAWTIFLLDRHPQERRRVAEELRAAPVDSLPARLPVTTAAISETLRLYPPTWLLARKLLHEETVHGTRFARGHTFYLSPFITGRDGQYFERPRSFTPRRWEDAAFRKQLPVCAYFPFGAGSRRCLGQYLATLELKLLVAMLVRECELKVVDPGRVRLGARRGLRPLNLTVLRTA